MQISQDQFKRWITQYHEALYRHALWMTGNTEVAKDIVQDTYFQGWKYRTSLRDESKALAWLLTILRRLVYKECRHDDMPLQDTGLDAIVTDTNDNIDAMIDLERGLRNLNVSQREILLLHALHGFSYAEISAQLDIPPGTVMSRLARARKALGIVQQESRHGSNTSNVIDINTFTKVQR